MSSGRRGGSPLRRPHPRARGQGIVAAHRAHRGPLDARSGGDPAARVPRRDQVVGVGLATSWAHAVRHGREPASGPDPEAARPVLPRSPGASPLAIRPSEGVVCGAAYRFAGKERAYVAPSPTHFASWRLVRTSSGATRSHPRIRRPRISMSRAFDLPVTRSRVLFLVLGAISGVQVSSWKREVPAANCWVA